jgi:hypothetical protein
LDRTASEEINAQRAIMLRYAENVVKGIISERCKIEAVQSNLLLRDND